MPLVSAIHTAARVLLNDTVITGGSLFTDTVLLPITKKAYQELQDELALNGLGDIIEVSSAPIAVAIGAITVTLPTDLVVPMTLWERPSGGAESDWAEMTSKAITPGMTQTEELKYWEWREDAINLVGATTAREVKIKYVKALADIVDVTTNIPVINCTVYLAARVAAIAAIVIGGNPGRAGLYQADAKVALERLINTLVKRKQDSPTRRIPFRANQ